MATVSSLVLRISELKIVYNGKPYFRYWLKQPRGDGPLTRDPTSRNMRPRKAKENSCLGVVGLQLTKEFLRRGTHGSDQSQI